MPNLNLLRPIPLCPNPLIWSCLNVVPVTLRLLVTRPVQTACLCSALTAMILGQCGRTPESHPNQVSITDKKESPASLEKVVESPSVDLKSLQQLQEIQKRVDTYNLKPTCCTPRTIEYLAWFEVASCCQESDWVNLDTQLQCKSGWELEQLDQLTLARIGKVSIDKTGPRSTLYIERLTHYTQVCKDLFTVGRFVDTVEVSKESQNQDLQSRVTFAVGSR